MRRFELVEGSSSKYWEIAVSGADLTVRFGRIGTSGQSKTKTFPSDALADAEAARLIKEKLGKGYAEVSAVAPPASPASATKQVGSENLPPNMPPAPEAALETAPAVEFAWPQGGYDWNDALRARLPVMRGVHVPPHEQPAAKLSLNKDFELGPASYQRRGFDEIVAAQQAAGYPIPGCQPPSPWSRAEAEERTRPERLAQPDQQLWNELFFQCAARHDYLGYLCQCVAVGHHLHGLAFVLERIIDLAPGLLSRWYGGSRTVHELRHAIAAAAAAEHEKALAVASTARGRRDDLDCLLSYLFPEQSAWAEECAGRGLPADLLGWLAETRIPVATAVAVARNRRMALGWMVSAALLQVALHGESALPCLIQLLDVAESRSDTEEALAIICRLRTPALIPSLSDYLDRPEVRNAFDRLAETWPAATLKTVIAKAAASRQRTIENWLLRLALRHPEAQPAALAASSPEQRQHFANLAATVAEGGEAAIEDLPELLANPPWRRAEKPQPVPTLALPPWPVAAAMAWLPDQRQAWAAYTAPPWFKERWEADPAGMSFEAAQLAELAIQFPSHPRILAGEALQPQDIQKRAYFYLNIDRLLVLPEAVALAIWNSMPAAKWSSWTFVDGAQAILARHELAALPGLLACIAAYPETGLALAQPFAAGAIAPLAAHALKNLKKARWNAELWLDRHAECALASLLPQAFGKDRVPRENAQFALRWLAANGHADRLREVAAHFGSEAVAAAEALLAADPLLLVPAKLPRLPAYFVPAAFRRPRLKAGGCLPLPAVEAIGTMLAISSLAEPYAGIDIVKAACQPASLAEFAWDLFDAWLAAGAPSKEAWAFTALGLLGDDETARRLAPRIREWPGESAHARAVTGLDLLAAIGSDVALMHLNGIASKVKFKGLQDKAREKIAAVAEARGLSSDELADRLVPDLGLDEGGSVVLDFGPRLFEVAFDETLKPYVKDAGGVRLKDLPKPNRSDDETLAAAAVERYKALKKDARAIASLQLVRFELAMCSRRRWRPADFRLFFIDHPLQRHLARRLVWGVYRDGGLVDAFRIAEDLSLADRHDDLYRLPDDVEVGIAHVLEMPVDLAADFGQIFGDYEILQPFRQLGRETYALHPDEAAVNAIRRFKGKNVATGSLMGLVNRGWERGQAMDAGWVGCFVKRLPGALEVELKMEPGLVVGDIGYEPRQSIPEIVVRQAGSWDANGLRRLDGLDPILLSEIIRDADLLAPAD